MALDQANQSLKLGPAFGFFGRKVSFQDALQYHLSCDNLGKNVEGWIALTFSHGSAPPDGLAGN